MVAYAHRTSVRKELVRAAWAATLLCGLAWLSACSGSLGDGDAVGDGDGDTVGDGDASSDGPASNANPDENPDLRDVFENNPGGVTLECDDGKALSEGNLLKLSTVQYRNSVRDLLSERGLSAIADQIAPLLDAIPDDSASNGFRGLDDRIAIEHVQGYFDVGVAIADAITGDDAALRAVAGACALTGDLDDSCLDGFLDDFMQLVHRRPLLDEERALYGSLRADASDGRAAIRAAIIVGLSSPRFIYHVEVDGQSIGGSDDLLTLDAHEVASRLSYSFWRTSPDAALRAAAADGSLLEPDGYRAQLERVWADPRTRATLQQFWTEWLKLDRFTGFETTRPAFQSLARGEGIGEPGRDHYGDMVAEIHDLTALFTFEQPGGLPDLLETRVSVTRSRDLANLYNIEPWDGSGAYPELPEGERAGLLQRAALLVSNLEQTNPFHRGALVRTAILCDPLAKPDPNSLPPGSLDPPPVDSAQTTRERFAAKVAGNNLCATCHDTFSNIGFVLESFDALGRYRTTEQVFDEQNGMLLAELPIDTRAEARIASNDEPAVADAAELNERIIASRKVEACLAKNYFAYLTRRAMSSSSIDACVVNDLAATLENRDGGLADAFQRLAQVPTFLTRRVGQP